MNFKNMSLENRKKFEKIAYENGLNIQHDNTKKVADDKNPYWSEPTYYAYAGYCLAQKEKAQSLKKLEDVMCFSNKGDSESNMQADTLCEEYVNALEESALKMVHALQSGTSEEVKSAVDTYYKMKRDFSND